MERMRELLVASDVLRGDHRPGVSLQMRRPSAFPLPLAGVVVVTVSCGELIGADDYSVATGIDGAAGRSATVATFEAPPAYLTDETCVACVSEHCAAQKIACDDEAFCASWLDSMRNAPDPLSAYDRYRLLMNEAWEGSHGGTDDSAHTLELIDCTSANCLNECQLGRDFSCVGKFEWHIGFPSALRTAVSDMNGLPFPEPWTVKACAPEDANCSTPLTSQTTDDYGAAELLLGNGQDQYPDFGGFLLWTGGTDFNEWATIVSRPFVTDDYTAWKLPNKSLVDVSFGNFGAQFDPAYGYVWVIPSDCRGLYAKGVRLNVKVGTANGFEDCTDCMYTYENNNSLPDTQRQDFSSAGRVGFISFVPPRRILLTLRDTANDSVIGVQSISVAAGRIHFVKLYPASTSQLADANAEP